MGDGTIRVAWLAGGHPFDRPSLTDMIASLRDVQCELIEWPDAGRLFTPAGVDRLLSHYDVLVLYDMPGIRFRRGEAPTFDDPPSDVIEAWKRLTTEGMPVLSMHHSIASWPTWEGFAEIVKGRFHYVPGRLRGTQHPDSGYAMNVRQQFTVSDKSHPVCAGLPETFELTDETYQCPVFEDEVDVLITTDAPRDDSFHLSALAAVRREANPEWRHAPTSAAVAWTHVIDRSTVVYLQPGDGPEAFENATYRKLIENGVHWLATTKGRQPL